MCAAVNATYIVVDDNELDLYLAEQLVGLTKQLWPVASFPDAQETPRFTQAHTETALLLAMKIPAMSGSPVLLSPERPHAALSISSHRDFARVAVRPARG